MDKVNFRACVKQFSNGSYLFLPATLADKKNCDIFCEQIGNGYVSVTAEKKRANRTIDQNKTVWALISIIYESQYNKRPTDGEAKLLYEELLKMYAPRVKGLLNPDEEVTASLSMMDKYQTAEFIGRLIDLVRTYCNLNDRLSVDVKQVFEDYIEFRSSLSKDPVDMRNGEYLSTEEWLKINNVSMASGSGEALEIAHIISKGSAPQFRDCCWNFIRLTHEEHIEVQHRFGWEHFIELYPHLRGRIERAEKLSGHKVLGRSTVEVVKDLFDGEEVSVQDLAKQASSDIDIF